MPPSERAAGRVILKAILCPNGSVGRVGIVAGASKQLNESAIEPRERSNLRLQLKTKNESRSTSNWNIHLTFPDSWVDVGVRAPLLHRASIGWLGVVAALEFL